jgi:hypothetical protein
MKGKKYFVISLLIIFSTMFLQAQLPQTGSMRGRVVDKEGEPLPGVSITVTGPALIGREATVTNENGLFRIASLPPGKEYAVLAEIGGFQPVKREMLIVQVGVTVSVEIQMQLSEIKADDCRNSGDGRRVGLCANGILGRRADPRGE